MNNQYNIIYFVCQKYLPSAYIGFVMFLAVLEYQAGDNDAVLLKRRVRVRPLIKFFVKYKFLIF